MLIEFTFHNYRSFRDEANLSLEATGIGTYKNSLISYRSEKLLPSVAIYGKNGGGKSNVIRAFWLATQFIRSAQQTQHQDAEIPVTPFALNDYSKKEPTAFSFVYVSEGVKYWYGFSATKTEVQEEYLYHAPKGQKALVFDRKGQDFKFTEEKTKRSLIQKMVSKNQLFLSIASALNDAVCANAMRWFREYVLFSKDYADISKQLLELRADRQMLKAVSDYVKAADLGIQDVKILFRGENSVQDSQDVLDAIVLDYKMIGKALKVLESSEPYLSDAWGRINPVNTSDMKVLAKHQGKSKNGDKEYYNLSVEEESDGTLRLMSLAPAIEATLQKGGVLLIDEIERDLHIGLINFIISKFQSKQSNLHGAQLIFTTHNTELLNLHHLRKDQIYFVDKNSDDGVSELYSLTDFDTRTTDNIRKGYLAGKFGSIPNVELAEVD